MAATNAWCTCTRTDGSHPTVHLTPGCPGHVEWRDRRPAACYRLECNHREHDGRPNPLHVTHGLDCECHTPQHERAATPQERADFVIPETCRADANGQCIVHELPVAAATPTTRQEPTVERYTYQRIIRTYADQLRDGTSDTDLSPRQRRLAAVVLATASNDGRASCYYPPTDQTRADVLRATGDALWTGNARALMDAVGPAAAEDFGVALERALEVLRNI